ncbi:MAG TPA: HNH endonuclease [Bacillus bacterium]|nr:HNH endonuclease [Bacillus sp. (in: firmicutes)]
MRKIVFSLLTLVLLFSFTAFTPAKTLDITTDYSIDDNYSSIVVENYSDAAEQLKYLHKKGYIPELITEKDLKDKNKISHGKDKNVKILSEGTYIVGLDTETKKTFDFDEFRKEVEPLIENKTYESQSPQIEFTTPSMISIDIDTETKRLSQSEYTTLSSSLLWYTVAFETWVDANTTYPKINHSAQVTGVYGVGTRPTNYTIIAKIQRATSKSGTYSNAASTTKTVPLKAVVSISAGITATNYWKTDSRAYANYSDGSYPADSIIEGPYLLNKKGVPYVIYKDPKSGKVMTEPSSTTWAKVSATGCALTTTERTNYKKWYDNNYGALNWADYEIHHIRPCAYGGTKDYSNLIPIPYSFHRSIVTPWWANY